MASRDIDLKKFKFDLPETWREASRVDNDGYVSARVYHVNPLSALDPKRFQDQVSYRGEVSVNRIAVQAPARGMRPTDEMFKMFETLISGGIMPPDMMTAKQLNELKKGITQTPHGERPGASDIASDIDITRYPNEETAWQALKNKGLMQTQGFDVPIPGNVKIPGMPAGATMSDVFESGMLEKLIPAEHLGKFEKLRAAMKNVGKQMPGIKQRLEQKGVSYGEGTYLGCKTVYLKTPNHVPPPQPKSVARPSGASASGLGMGGKGVDAFGKREGHIAHLDPLPTMAPEPYSATTTMYLGLLFKDFVIDGSLLWGIEQLPSGKTPCYSLTKTKEVVSTDTVEGKKFTGISIVPLPSTFAREGYVHREEVEELYRGVIAGLERYLQRSGKS